MTKIFPVEVGQTVYVGVFRGLAATMPTETDAYDTKYILFRSEEDYAVEMLRRSYIHAIRNSKFTDIFSCLDISFDAAKAIYEILKAEGVARLDPVE